MELLLQSGWWLFCIAMGVAIITSQVMSYLGKRFYTDDVVVRRFSIMDLQLAAKAVEISNLVSGIYKLPAKRAASVEKALKWQLYIDFVFMVGAYSAIFILCMQLSDKMLRAGAGFFRVLAWLQFVPLCCDMIENIYLLGKIKPDLEKVELPGFRVYQWAVAIKWIVALFATVCAGSGLLYFWLSGQFEERSFRYGWVVLAEVAVMVALGRILGKKHTISDKR